MADSQQRIERALMIASSYGQVDGDHHKAWVIDQMVRALTGCPLVNKTFVSANGEYDAEVQGESEEYLQWVDAYCEDEDGPETYHWDEGIAP